MFQFSHLPPAEDFQQVPGYKAGWVAPFGDLRLRLPATCRSFSQLGYVLLRLSAPYHPPHALSIFVLTVQSRLIPLIRYLLNCQSTRDDVSNGMSGHGSGGIRTPDLVLAKHVLSQLSYTPECLRPASHDDEESARADSNCRPHAYQACALTN